MTRCDIGIKNINVRFYAYSFTEPENELDIIELTESEWLAIDCPQISYERNTVFANGVSQICLTKQNIDNPIYEREL